MTTIETYLNESAAFDQQKHDHMLPIRALQFDNDCRLVLPASGPFGGTPPLELTEWAYTQAYQKLGPLHFKRRETGESSKALPADFFNDADPAFRAEMLNRIMGKANGKEWLVRGYADKARAILGKEYAKIQNTDLLQMLWDLYQSGPARGAQTVRSHVDADSMYLRVIWRDVDMKDGRYGVGVCIRNNELGGGKAGVDMLVQRHACTNSIIGTGKVEFVHRGSLTAKKTLLASAIAEALEASEEMLNAIIRAQGEEIPDFTEILKGVAVRQGLTSEQLLTLSEGTERAHTTMGVVNGITWLAHEDADLSPARAYELESYAGALLLDQTGNLFDQVRQAYRKEQVALRNNRATVATEVMQLEL